MAIKKLYTIDHWKSQLSVLDIKKQTLEIAVQSDLQDLIVDMSLLYSPSIYKQVMGKLLDSSLIDDFVASGKSKLVFHFNANSTSGEDVGELTIPEHIINLVRINPSELKTNFITSLKESENKPVCDPYGWKKIQQRISNVGHLEKVTEIWGIEKWIFKGYVYEFSGHEKLSYSDNQKPLLIMEYFDQETKKFEKLRRSQGSHTKKQELTKRKRIPERVRNEVWRRDEGKCVKCDSREKLEYDHIIPISKGGSNTARNIELLCEECNRSKGNRIEG